MTRPAHPALVRVAAFPFFSIRNCWPASPDAHSPHSSGAMHLEHTSGRVTPLFKTFRWLPIVPGIPPNTHTHFLRPASARPHVYPCTFWVTQPSDPPVRGPCPIPALSPALSAVPGTGQGFGKCSGTTGREVDGFFVFPN